MVATPEKPLGRMTARKIGTGQPRNIRLWGLDAPPGSTAEGLLKHYLGSLAGVDRLKAKKAELASSVELTPIGVQKAATDFSFREIVPGLQKGRLAVQRAKQEVAGRRAKLAPPKSDPTDMAAALRRQEIRTMMRAMDTKARDAFLKQNGKFTGLDPEIRQALVEMPASVSGITEGFRDGLVNESMQSAYGPELDQIAEPERAIEITSSALGETSEEVRREAIAVDPAFADPDVYCARSDAGCGRCRRALVEEVHRERRRGRARREMGSKRQDPQLGEGFGRRHRQRDLCRDRRRIRQTEIGRTDI